jgi:hypothetical protein
MRFEVFAIFQRVLQAQRVAGDQIGRLVALAAVFCEQMAALRGEDETGQCVDLVRG